MTWEIPDALAAIGLFDGQAVPTNGAILQANGVATFTRNGPGDYTIALDQPQAPRSTLVLAQPVAGNFALFSGAAQNDGTVRVFAFDPRSAAPVDVTTFLVVVMRAPATLDPTGTLPAPVIPPVGVGSLQTAYNGGPRIDVSGTLGPATLAADAGDPPSATEALLELDGALTLIALEITQQSAPGALALLLSNPQLNLIQGAPAAVGSGSFGASVSLAAGAGDGAGPGGNFQTSAGAGGDTGPGGSLIGSAGVGGATSGDGGELNYSAGNSLLGNGGDATYRAGNALGDGNGGQVSITSGGANGVGDAGELEVRAGSNVGGTGNGGTLRLTSGQGSGIGGVGGDVVVLADRGGTDEGAGAVLISVVSAVGANSDGGQVQLVAPARSGVGAAQGVVGFAASLISPSVHDHAYGSVDRHLASRGTSGTLGVAMVTTAQKNALIAPADTCLIVFDTDTGQLERNPGGAGWAAV